MGWTTGQNTAAMITVLKTAGALQDQAQSALASLAHRPNTLAELWGVLVQCTTGWNAGDPMYEYDTSPSLANTGKTFAQMVTALTGAGATTDQATQILHGLAWFPNKPFNYFGLLLECTSGWNSTTAPVYSYTSNPS